MALVLEEKMAVKAATKFLVWYGTLPAPKVVDMCIGTRDKDSITRDYFRIEAQEAADLWIGADNARTWVGKCRFHQSISVRGFVFNAFSASVERSGTNENEMSAAPFPGSVQIMKQKEIDRIVKSCCRHVVRFGAGNGDIYSLKNNNKTKIVDLDSVVKPASWTQEQWIAERQRIPMEGNVFDSDTDVPVAEFVYLVPLEIQDFDSLHSATGVLDVGACVAHLPCQRLDRKFFTNPPKSVAEAFPLKS